MNPASSPARSGERITNLDTVRGSATLGILIMNAVSFGLPGPAYFNVSDAGSDNWLDWVVGVAGEIFVAQNTMALFSILFGAGIVVFADQAEAKGNRRPTCVGPGGSVGLGVGAAVAWFARCCRHRATTLTSLRRSTRYVLLPIRTLLANSCWLLIEFAGVADSKRCGAVY